MAGGAADCQFWETWLGTQCRLHELRERKEFLLLLHRKF